jgi:hypothetical protein
METLETDVGGSNRGGESLPRKEGQGLPDAAQRGNQCAAAGTALKAHKCPAKDQQNNAPPGCSAAKPIV